MLSKIAENLLNKRRKELQWEYSASYALQILGGLEMVLYSPLCKNRANDVPGISFGY